MARIKLKYNITDIKTDLYTFGKEWATEDGQEYIGLYHRYISTNETYTGANWGTTSKKLIKFYENNNVNFYRNLSKINVLFQTPYPERTIITDEDQKKGFVNRYFLKKFNDSNVIEISKKQFDLYQNNKIDKNAYISATVKWYITGDAAKNNLKSVNDASQQIPQLRSILSNLSQFYTDTDFNVPRDINGLK